MNFVNPSFFFAGMYRKGCSSMGMRANMVFKPSYAG